MRLSTTPVAPSRMNTRPTSRTPPTSAPSPPIRISLAPSGGPIVALAQIGPGRLGFRGGAFGQLPMSPIRATAPRLTKVRPPVPPASEALIERSSWPVSPLNDPHDAVVVEPVAVGGEVLLTVVVDVPDDRARRSEVAGGRGSGRVDALDLVARRQPRTHGEGGRHMDGRQQRQPGAQHDAPPKTGSMRSHNPSLTAPGKHHCSRSRCRGHNRRRSGDATAPRSARRRAHGGRSRAPAARDVVERGDRVVIRGARAQAGDGELDLRAHAGAREAAAALAQRLRPVKRARCRGSGAATA